MARLYPAVHPVEVLNMRIDLILELISGGASLHERAMEQAGTPGGSVGEYAHPTIGPDGLRRVRVRGGIEELRQFLQMRP